MKKKLVSSRSAHSSAKSPGPVRHAVERGVLDELLGYQLRRAQTLLFMHFQQHLTSLNVTPGQLGLLMMIAANPGVSQVSLARAVGIERASLGEFIDRFVREQLVERRAMANDRRSYAVHLTRAGERFLDEAIPAVKAHEAAFAGRLTAHERKQLLKLLSKLTAPNADAAK